MPTSISGAVASDGLKTSTLGDCTKKCQQTLATLLESLHLLGEGNTIDASSIVSLSLLHGSLSTLEEAIARCTKTCSPGGKHCTSSSPSPPKRWISEEVEKGLEEGIEDAASPGAPFYSLDDAL